MAHFAQIDENNFVVRVIVLSNDLEQTGEQWCTEHFGGLWKQTSYNHNIRKQYAGIGFIYDPHKDIFISPQPFLSWSLNENSDWIPPVEYPSDGAFYYWDEENQNWVNPPANEG